jgi:hypothetical protein
VPGHVEELILTPFSHNISVNWKKPISDRYCVTRYVIHWVHALSGSNDSSIVEIEEDSYVIRDLDACVEYKVSVSAMNEKNNSSVAVTGNTRTEAVGIYLAQIILLYLLCGCAYVKGNADIMSVRLDL